MTTTAATTKLVLSAPAKTLATFLMNPVASGQSAKPSNTGQSANVQPDGLEILTHSAINVRLYGVQYLMEE